MVPKSCCEHDYQVKHQWQLLILSWKMILKLPFAACGLVQLLHLLITLIRFGFFRSSCRKLFAAIWQSAINLAIKISINSRQLIFKMEPSSPKLRFIAVNLYAPCIIRFVVLLLSLSLSMKPSFLTQPLIVFRCAKKYSWSISHSHSAIVFSNLSIRQIQKSIFIDVFICGENCDKNYVYNIK